MRRGHIPNLTKPKRLARKSHEEIEHDLADYLDSGKEIQIVPGFTEQDIRPRASYAFGEGPRSGG